LQRSTIHLPESVTTTVEKALDGSILATDAVGGGCIANACRMHTTSGDYFLKWAPGDAGSTFTAEGKGLAALADAADQLVVPRPLLAQDANVDSVGILVMDWLDEAPKDIAFWKALGEGLAALHAEDAGRDFGFESDNFIGRLPQKNAPLDDWGRFFVERRLVPQMVMARDGGRWQSGWTARFEELVRRIPDILDSHPKPSLVHGDLWSGNVLATNGGRAALVDPAVYRGDREVDLAMSELFGGFSARFYDAYKDAWPLEPGYPERRDLYNLYHLINHLNHFGSGYAGQVEAVLRRFS